MDEICDIVCSLAISLRNYINVGIEEADTKEVGEIADIIKDLTMANYYIHVVEAMKEHPESVPDWTDALTKEKLTMSSSLS